MVARVEKTVDGYAIPLTAEMMHELRLAEGAEIELRPVDHGAPKVAGDAPQHGDRALRSYERSKERFGAAYEALAK